MTAGKRSLLHWLVAVVAWMAVCLALVSWALLYWADAHWLGTLMAFGPRWALLLPVGLWAIVAGVLHRRALLPLGLAVLVIAGPVMGFCMPWRAWLQRQGGGSRIKILTLNTLQGRAEARLPGLIEREQPDVIVLQEWASQRPIPGATGGNWQTIHGGGTTIASRLPILTFEERPSPASQWRLVGLRCELQTSIGPVQLFGLHPYSPRDGLAAVERLQGLEELARVTQRRRLDIAAADAWLDQHSGPTIVAGDLNLVPESALYRRRLANLQNAFSTAGWGYGGTLTTRYHRVRIDHILADDHFQIVNCKVGPNVGSDHLPVVAELAINVLPIPLKVVAQ